MLACAFNGEETPVSVRSTSVPIVPRPRRVPSRPILLPPAPDDEPYDHVDQIEFAFEYFRFVIALMIAMGLFAAYVLVPVAGLMFAV